MANNVNPMKSIVLEKVVLNIGIGNSEDKLENAKLLLKKLTGRQPAHTRSRRRMPEFGIRKDQIIGTMVTLRNKEAANFLKTALDANNYVVQPNAIANNSLSFGIKEYIYFSGVKYDPKIGMLGLNVNASFMRRGARVERRKRKNAKTAKHHKEITKEELAEYITKNFDAKMQERE